MNTPEYCKNAIDICTNYFIKRMYHIKQVIDHIKTNFNSSLKHQIIKVTCAIEHYCDLELLEHSLNQDSDFLNYYIVS